MKRISCSPLTDIIYVGTTKKQKSGRENWVNKEDMTDQAIAAVFEHMYNKARETGFYEISYKGFGKMQLHREDAPSEKDLEQREPEKAL